MFDGKPPVSKSGEVSVHPVGPPGDTGQLQPPLPLLIQLLKRAERRAEAEKDLAKAEELGTVSSI